VLAEVRASCGHYYLEVAGISVAMAGDVCREGEIPEELHDPIPEEELAHATIGGQPAKDMPIDIVRMFRSSHWNKAMLEWVANKINSSARTTD
jgi:hypothetical protein